MQDLPEDSHKSGKVFGLTRSLFRGIIAMTLLVIGLYAILFESEPPPVFEDVEIHIPEPPNPDFSERTIDLPDFEASPVEESVEPGEGVVVTSPEVDIPPELTAVNEASEPEESDIVLEAETALISESESTQEAESPDDTTTKRTALQGYFVQVAAFETRDIAEELAELIGSSLDEPYYVLAVDRDDKILYRVRLGPYGDDEARARNTLTRLRKLDIGELGPSSQYFVDLE